MSKLFLSQSWICSACFQRRQQRLRRHLATAASFTTTTTSTSGNRPYFLQVDHSPPVVHEDDRLLRQIFDSPPTKVDSMGSGRSVGLFNNRYIKSDNDFQSYASVTLEKAKKLVNKVLGISTLEGYRGLVRDLDRLSDLLCRVIDLCDFIRAAPPTASSQRVASAAHAAMYEYMNVLNTTTNLFFQLKKAASIPEVTASWSDEEKQTAHMLLTDFKKSAIDFSPEDRKKFVHISNQISQMGPIFVDNVAVEKEYIVVDSPALKGLNLSNRIHTYIVQSLSMGRKSIMVPTTGRQSVDALKSIADENVRRQLYLASRTASPAQIERLEILLRLRAELAGLSGYSSYAQMALEDKMAKSSESVLRFLRALLGENKRGVEMEYSQLLEMKKSDNPESNENLNLHAWDRDYYLARRKSQNGSTDQLTGNLREYFSLGTVIQGLSRLFSHLYGIRLVPREPGPGEIWNHDVRRLDVMDETEGHIAVIYCDLFERPGKTPNPAHFTLRCSRRISEQELDELASEEHLFTTVEEAATDGLCFARNAQGHLMQLPTIALICDFQRSSTQRPTLLSFRDVQTIFHEMGHALQSIFGRTSLQNVSGTRCATDFAELPSVLMEHFASSQPVLGLFARHWKTDAPLDYSLVAQEMSLERFSENTEIERQIIFSMLDQAYHSSLPLERDFNSTAVYHDVMARHATLPEPSETTGQAFFGHLFGYGATYYSYLFDRAIAGKIWRDVFLRSRHGLLDREAGEHFREQVLKWGGSRDGWRCVAGALGDESLAEGGEAAMAKVGKWGVRH